ncbi:hypothetical protein [Catellatospora tritici]|uniref:hypothetical protein n=1 Tax=Catellatospora tritici TaxID=2851566 RepID=UPI001C2D8BCC|nr:hypothetical protein [Catellatospora tritici]MBV1854118.1 hypothetical protein [Catellatospora tritici]
MEPYEQLKSEVAAMAAGEVSVVTLMNKVLPKLKAGDTAPQLMFLLVPTFNIPLLVMHEALEWQGFALGGQLSDRRLEELLAPYILGR